MGSADGVGKSEESSGAEVGVDTEQEDIQEQLVDGDSQQPTDGIVGFLAMVQVVLRSLVKREPCPAVHFCTLQPLT